MRRMAASSLLWSVAFICSECGSLNVDHEPEFATTGKFCYVLVECKACHGIFEAELS